MSIRLLEAILIDGVHTPADGSTLTLAPAFEADLVNRNKAVYVVAPAAGRDTQALVDHVLEHLDLAPTDVTYDGSSRVSTFKSRGVDFTVTYNGAGLIETLVGGGRSITFGYDGSDRYTGRTIVG